MIKRVTNGADLLDPKDIRIDGIEDRPRGMWHTGPNSCWVVATHLPTGCQARAYHAQQWKARDAALMVLELMVDEVPHTPRFLENVSQ